MHDEPDFSESQWARIRNGDEPAFAELITRYKRPVLNYVYRMLGNAAEADDVAQDVFVRAYRNIGRFRPGARFSAWLFQVARNAAVDQLRRRERRAEVPLGRLEPAARAGAEVEHRELGERIAAAVAELPEDQRTAFVLAEYHGMSYAEIAEILVSSGKSVESRLYRAKRHLRARLADLL